MAGKKASSRHVVAAEEVEGVEEERRLDVQQAAQGEGAAEVEQGEGGGVGGDVEQVAEVEGELEDWHRRDGNLEEPSLADLPAVGRQRPSPSVESTDRSCVAAFSSGVSLRCGSSNTAPADRGTWGGWRHRRGSPAPPGSRGWWARGCNPGRGTRWYGAQ